MITDKIAERIKKIGFACMMTSKKFSTNHTIRLKSLTNKDYIVKIIQKNLTDLENILNFMSQFEKMRLFRIGSGFIPFASHPTFSFRWEEILAQKLASIGKKYLKKGFIFSMHPGQYTILNSPSMSIVQNSIREIEYSSKLLDLLGCDQNHKIIIHVGGVYCDKKESIKRFIKNLLLLSKTALKRLAIENDEKNYNFGEVVQIAEISGLSPVFDFHHHQINPCQDIKNFLRRARKIWRNPPEIHLSSQRENARLGSHDDWIKINDFKNLVDLIDFDFHLMIEAKKKEEAVFKLKSYFAG